MKTLQIRANNAFNTLLLVAPLVPRAPRTARHVVIGAWDISPTTLASWTRPGDLDDWSETWPDVTDPEEYGQLVATWRNPGASATRDILDPQRYEEILEWNAGNLWEPDA